MATICPDNETLMDFTEGRLSGRQRSRIENHLADCALCREQVTVCADLLYGDFAGEEVQAPEALTERAVKRVNQLHKPNKHDSVMERTRQWAIKGMAVIEHLVSWGEPEAVAVRGNAVVTDHLIRRTKQFEDVQVDIEIEKSGTAQSLIRIIPLTELTSALPVRVTLLKREREMASMLLTQKPILFEDIAFGVYSLLFTRGDKLGEYTFEIAEQAQPEDNS